MREKRRKISSGRSEEGRRDDLSLVKWMTVKQVSVYLQISVSKVYQMAQEGQIPCYRLGQQWRFDREEIDRWLKATDKNRPL